MTRIRCRAMPFPTPSTIAKSEHSDYVAPINLCALQKSGGTVQHPDFEPGAALDDVYNTDAHVVLTLPEVPRTILEVGA